MSVVKFRFKTALTRTAANSLAVGILRRIIMKKTSLSQFGSFEEVNKYFEEVSAQEQEYVSKRNAIDIQIRNLESQIKALEKQKEELRVHYERVSI